MASGNLERRVLLCCLWETFLGQVNLNLRRLEGFFQGSGGAMSSLAAAKTRLVADPSIGVSDLMAPLQKLIESRDDRHVFKLVQAPPNVSWKSGTPVQWLCNLAPLWKSYVKIAPNTIIWAPYSFNPRTLFF